MEIGTVSDWKNISDVVLIVSLILAAFATVGVVIFGNLKDDLLLWERLELFLRPLEQARNDYVHHIWAYSADLPDKLVLIDPSHLSEITAQNAPQWPEINELKKKIALAPPEEQAALFDRLKHVPVTPLDRDKAFCYAGIDIEQAEIDVKKGSLLLDHFDRIVRATFSIDQSRHILSTELPILPSSQAPHKKSS